MVKVIGPDVELYVEASIIGVVELYTKIERLYNVNLITYYDLMGHLDEWIKRIGIFDFEERHEDLWGQLRDFYIYVVMEVLSKLGAPIKSFFKVFVKNPLIPNQILRRTPGYVLRLDNKSIVVLGVRKVSDLGCNNEEEVYEFFYVYENELDKVEEIFKELRVEDNARYVLENL